MNRVYVRTLAVTILIAMVSMGAFVLTDNFYHKHMLTVIVLRKQWNAPSQS